MDSRLLLNKVIGASGSVSGIPDQSIHDDGEDDPVETTENDDNVTLLEPIRPVISTPTTESILRRGSSRIGAKGKGLQDSQREAKSPGRAKKTATKVSSKPPATTKRGDAMSKLPVSNKERNTNAKKFLSRTVQKLQQYDSLYGDNIEIKFEAVYRPLRNNQEVPKLERYSFQSSCTEVNKRDESNRAMAEALDASRNAAPSSSTPVAGTSTNQTLLSGSLALTPVVEESMCIQKVYGYNCLSNEILIQCTWSSDELGRCQNKWHAECFSPRPLNGIDDRPLVLCPKHHLEKLLSRA